MVKLYKVNGQTVVEESDKIKIIEADFRINPSGGYVDIVNETKPGQVWSVPFTEFQDKDGNLVGSTVEDIINYVSSISVSKTDVRLGGANLDSFGRLRTSELTTQIDVKQIHGNSDLFINKEQLNGGTFLHDEIDSSTEISVISSGDRVVHQTKQRLNYQSGKSQLIMLTGYNFNSQTDVLKRIGYFSSSTVSPFTASLDGLFLQSDNTGISINIYKTGTLIEQTYLDSWNGEKLDNETFENDFIVYLDFEWLGLGVVRWGLVENGEIKYFHTSRHDSLIKGVYMTSPNQPLRWEIESLGGSGSFYYVCGQVSSEGSLNQVGKILSENLGVNHVDANTNGNIYALLGMRLKADHLDSFIDVLNYSLVGLTNDSFLYLLLLNPTVNGTFDYNDIDNSSIQVAKGNVNNNQVTAGTGVILDSGYFIQRSSRETELKNAIRLGSNIDGTRDEFVLCAVPVTNGLDVLGSITWRELT